MTLVGVTGQTGAGKTTFCKVFRDIGAKVIDADKIGHKLHQEEGIKKQLVETFGEEILDVEGKINRKSLGSIVFENRKNREMLDEIMKKPLIDVIEARIFEIRDNGFPGIVVLDAALLPEWKKLHKLVDYTVLIEAPKWQRINRLEEKKGLEPEEAEKRIDALENLYDDFYPQIDYNVKNSGNIREFRAKVVKVWLDIKSHVGRQ
ncbi:MAG: dephospho-CoA kinase [Candidatus Zixiibacteriota bacterium]